MLLKHMYDSNEPLQQGIFVFQCFLGSFFQNKIYNSKAFIFLNGTTIYFQTLDEMFTKEAQILQTELSNFEARFQLKVICRNHEVVTCFQKFSQGFGVKSLRKHLFCLYPQQLKPTNICIALHLFHFRKGQQIVSNPIGGT